jgi:DNA-binding NtrC family response regulator
MPRVLIVEDERVLAKNVAEKLRTHDHVVEISHTAKDALACSAKFVPDVIILDLRLPDGDGLKLLPKLRAESPSTSVIVVTAHGNEQIAVEAMKAGAYEYLTKPIDLEELQLVVNRALDQQQVVDNLAFLRTQEEEYSGLDRIIGQSEAVQTLKETIRRLTRTEVLGLPDPPTVLITGETGTGKDLAARAIHYHGPRSRKPFISVNCTAIPTTLFESELFGHLRGAFTSASQSKRGLLEVANGGTVFLDEVGHLEQDMQAKLLHTVEHREIRPVGGTDARKIDVHIIAATNRDMETAVEQGTFRRDLYHRLRVIEINLPPLRERREDIPVLASHFLASHCRRFCMETKQFSGAALRALCGRSWRGNIRELSHAIESCILQVDGKVIEEGDLTPTKEKDESNVEIEIAGGRVIHLDFEKGRPTLEEVEQSILLAAYEYTNQNLSQAARILGLTREALRYRLNKSAEKTQ